MAFTLFTDLFNRIDTTVDTYVVQMSSAAITQLTPFVTTGLTLAFIAFAILIIRGGVQAPMSEFLAKSVKIALIAACALGSGIYQGQIAEAIQTTPDALASALLPAGEKGAEAAAMIDTAAQSGLDKTEQCFDQVSLFEGESLVWIFYGGVIFIATVAFVAIGGAFLLMAKIGLAIMAGLGPFFIAALLFQPTQKFFEAWVGQIANLAVLVVMMAASMGLMLNIFSGFVQEMALDGAQNATYNVGAILILAVAMLIALMKLPDIASSLGGGASAGMLHELRALAQGGKSAARGAGAAASAPGQIASGAGATLAGLRAHHAAHSAGLSANEARSAGLKAAGHFRGKRAA